MSNGSEGAVIVNTLSKLTDGKGKAVNGDGSERCLLL
jgi:hypothetical protein